MLENKQNIVSPQLVPIAGVRRVRLRSDPVPERAETESRRWDEALLCDSQNQRSRRGRDRAYESAHLIAAYQARSLYFKEKTGGWSLTRGREEVFII